MNADLAIVQSVFAFAIREINALEGRIVHAENDADAMLWEQAGQVVAQLEAGRSQRQLAAQWINLRTGEPYSKTHVVNTAAVFTGHFTDHPRPRFRDAYNATANASKAHVSHATGNYEWYSPSDVVEAARVVLGDIDLDPASSELANTKVGAARFFTLEEDGLSQPWRGRVWMNPPFAQPAIGLFAEKLAASMRATCRRRSSLSTTRPRPRGSRRWLPSRRRSAFRHGASSFGTLTATTPSRFPCKAKPCYFGRDVDRFCDGFEPFGQVWIPTTGQVSESCPNVSGGATVGLTGQTPPS